MSRRLPRPPSLGTTPRLRPWPQPSVDTDRASIPLCGRPRAHRHREHVVLWNRTAGCLSRDAGAVFSADAENPQRDADLGEAWPLGPRHRLSRCPGEPGSEGPRSHRSSCSCPFPEQAGQRAGPGCGLPCSPPGGPILDLRVLRLLGQSGRREPRPRSGRRLVTLGGGSEGLQEMNPGPRPHSLSQAGPPGRCSRPRHWQSLSTAGGPRRASPILPQNRVSPKWGGGTGSRLGGSELPGRLPGRP